jgi:hypothetical protein
MRPPSPIRIGAFAVASLLAPFVVMGLYLVLLLRAGIYLPHADVASWAGLAFSLVVGLGLFWQLPLRHRRRITFAVLYLVCLTPLLMILGLITICLVSGRCM